MKTITFKLSGEAPLIMHADTLVDPFHELAREKKRLTSKKMNKTDDDLRRIDEIEWVGAIYFDEVLGPYIPAANIERMLYDAATRTKAGQKAKIGLFANDDRMPLSYDGPRDFASLRADPRFTFRRSIKQGRGRIMRVRPWFHNWSLTTAITFDPKVFDEADVAAFMVTAGDYIGLGDWRPRYGRFAVERVK